MSRPVGTLRGPRRIAGSRVRSLARSYMAPYSARMSVRTELAELRNLLRALETGAMRIVRSSDDVTQREAAILKREIDNIERALKRAERKARAAKP